MTTPLLAPRSVGALLREWRQRRKLSQLALALAADVSQRHLSFVESGRTRPSREMVLRLAVQLQMPLRERNQLLLAAGFAPLYPERPLDDPALGAVRAAVERVLTAHEPYPALAVDRHWTLVAANRAVAPFLAGASPALLAPPVNVLRLSLHPEGVAPRIVNYRQWRAHLLERLHQQVAASGDDTLAALYDELRAYPPPAPSRMQSHMRHPPSVASDGAGLFVPLQLAVGDDDSEVLTFFSTTTVFGTPVDVTLAELALECFFPGDAETAERLRR
ncbi:MAG TPA: helix-turn-helix transcriptional regulator [Gemmatimonadaceae bacterium]|nr:helix-turn-helix transcriptional regulator [Gemmatimonadaceae bacterium]